MSNPIRPGLLQRVTSTTARTTATGAAAAAVRVPTERIVDLEATKTRATIVRGGEAVVTPIINVSRAAAVLDRFIPVPRMEVARSVTQSIASGTLVMRGTAIDVDFLPPSQVVLGIFDGVHLDLRDRNIGAVAALLADPEVAPALRKDASTLTPAERQNLTAKFAAANVGIDDASPDRSLGAALAGLRTAQAFR